MKTVLAPIDFSKVSRQVIDEAVVLARAIDARLVLLHVVQPAPIIASEFAIGESGVEVSRFEDQEAAQRLARLQTELGADGITAEVIHRVGYPGGKIVEVAKELKAAFIVVGAHGHTALYDLIVGSTTSLVLKLAPCPVVVTPAAMAKGAAVRLAREMRETAGVPRR